MKLQYDSLENKWRIEKEQLIDIHLVNSKLYIKTGRVKGNMYINIKL